MRIGIDAIHLSRGGKGVAHASSAVLSGRLLARRSHMRSSCFLGVAEALGVPVIEVLPAIRSIGDPTSLWLSPDDAHPNAEGHRIIADTITEAVLQHFGTALGIEGKLEREEPASHRGGREG